jgi:hypothetical protein
VMFRVPLVVCAVAQVGLIACGSGGTSGDEPKVTKVEPGTDPVIKVPPATEDRGDTLERMVRWFARSTNPWPAVALKRSGIIAWGRLQPTSMKEARR